MPKCSFCGEDLRRGTGKLFVYTDGRISYFCSMKCEKNQLKLKRIPANIKWTKRFRDEKKAAGQQPEQKAVKKDEAVQKQPVKEHKAAAQPEAKPKEAPKQAPKTAKKKEEK